MPMSVCHNVHSLETRASRGDGNTGPGRDGAGSNARIHSTERVDGLNLCVSPSWMSCETCLNSKCCENALVLLPCASGCSCATGDVMQAVLAGRFFRNELIWMKYFRGGSISSRGG
jgi:hypothetical protein